MSGNSFINIEDTKAYYLRNISRYGIEAPRTMGYHSAPIDDRLISNLLPEELPSSYSVLDVGCGLAQLIHILATKFPAQKMHKYVGLDLVDDFIQHSSKNFSQHQFITADFLEWQSSEKFDLVIAAGVLVTRMADFELYLEKFITKMIASTKKTLAFNVVAGCGPQYTAKHLAYISQDKLEAILAGFPQIAWKLENKEVFPGAQDTFVIGSVL